MKKRAQASIEYLVVAGLITLVILPSIYIFYGYSHKSNEEIKQSQINKVGTDIVDIAEKVYYLGEPSKVTIDATMPEGIVGIEVWKNQEIVFFLNDGTQIPFKSRVNITTDSLCTPLTDRCIYSFKETTYSQGLKRIIIKAKGDYVIIGEVDDEPDEAAEEPLSCIDIDADGYGVCPNCGKIIAFPCKFDGDDCDDTNDLIYPGATEVCNGVDDDCDGIIDEGFTNETCQYVCENNGYTWTNNEDPLNCCGNDPNEDSPYQDNEKTPNDYCSDENDNDCDGLTDADDPDCFECTPLTETRLCSEQDGVCADSFETCTAVGTWPGCDDSTYLAWNLSYENPETSCDTLDNDCDGTVDEEGDMINPLNSKQDGVCLGSTQSCIAGSWQDDYIGVANYEDPETSCSDGLDNDCDTESDYDSQDGRHGDNSCKVAVTAIAVSDPNPVEDSQIDVTCTVSPVVNGFNSIFAYIDENSNGVYDAGDSDCGWNLGSGWNAGFSEVTFKDCDVGSAGSKQAACGVYSSPAEPFDRSYQDGDDQTTTINVISSICSARTQSDCAVDSLCEWCYECESSIFGKEDSRKYSGDVSRCVDAGNCVYNCENNECGASCDGSVGCTATECDNLDGCYEGTYRDYSDIPNTCQADCTCTANLCISYITIITDNDNDGYDIECDNDCNDNNPNINPGATEICNGVDDDCNPGTADGSGETAPDNFKQDGVCLGSTKSCIAGSWQDDYSGVANYEATEATCYDSLDNDCDALTDCDDIVDCEGSICTADGANICVDGPYGPECVGAYG